MSEIIENELNVRLQHAVEHIDNNRVQHPDDTSIPLNGEIVFNDDRTNFKVGDGREEYQNLPDFLPTIPAAQIQSDWSQANSNAVDYIKNKPTEKSILIYDSTVTGAYTDFTDILNYLFVNTGHEYNINDYNGVLILIDITNYPGYYSTLECSNLFNTLKINSPFLIYIQSKEAVTTSIPSMTIFVGEYSTNSYLFNDYYGYESYTGISGMCKILYTRGVGTDIESGNYLYVIMGSVKVTKLKITDSTSRLFYE